MTTPRANRRASGILLHPTSLPGPGGIGTLGPDAHRFLERLAETGQTVWQVLPLGPTGYGDSPYQAFSAFAGNPLLISPELLARDGLLAPSDLDALPEGPGTGVDFGAVIPAKRTLLTKAHETFTRGAGPEEMRVAFDEFREREATWLDDFTLFTAIHEEDHRSWFEWPAALSGREPAALQVASERHRDDVSRIAFSQFLFFRHWGEVRARAAELGIEILGDLPFFVAHDSVDVWVNRDLFDLDEGGGPRVLAGAPPDGFTADGQLWGNPLYRWDRIRERGFDWWVDRARSCLGMFDHVRLDHFRGFCACWATQAGETTARNGTWTPVPGHELFVRLGEALGDLPFVAEDLGEITPDVDELRERFGFPGMRILQLGFSPDPNDDDSAPHGLTRNCVVYTGSHDHDTIQGWFREGMFARGRSAAEVEEGRRRILAVTGGDGSAIHWDFIRIALASVADTAIIPMQDVLGLGNEARMNRPGTPRGNWVWRMREGEWNPEIAGRLAELTRATERWPG